MFKFDAGVISTAATTAAFKTPAITLEIFQETMKQVEELLDNEAKAFNDAVKVHGFDLDAGDTIIVPPGTDISGVPERYRDRVRASPFADRAYLLRNPFYGLSITDRYPKA